MGEFELNLPHPSGYELFAHLALNSYDDSTQSLGFDGSGAGNNFVVEAVEVVRVRPVQAVGVGSDGSCYCSLEMPARLAVSPTVCDNFCEDAARTCGSTSSTRVVSLYRSRVVAISDLSPNTTYEVAVSLAISGASDMEITERLVATTTGATIPGQANHLSLAEQSGNYLELQWSSPDDDGGLSISNYFLYINGFLASKTGSGTTLSAPLVVPDTLTDYFVSVCAVNTIGQGPQSPLLLIDASGIEEPYPLSHLELFAVTGGTVTFVLDESAVTAMENATISVVVEQRASHEADFSTSVLTVSDDLVITVYKLLHDSLYVFRAYTQVRSSGVHSPFTSSVVVKTGRPGDPSKTPSPSITSTTGTVHKRVDL